MYGYVYMTTNLINGMLYVGKHKGDFSTERYLGSGKLLLRAIKKYGRRNFQVNLLATAETEKELNDLEIEFIDRLNCVEDKRYYNIMQGGHGGTIPLDEEARMIKARKVSLKVRAFHSTKAGEEFRKRHSQRQSAKKYSPETNKKKGLKGSLNKNYGNKNGYGGSNHPRAYPVEIVMPNGESHVFECRLDGEHWIKENLGVSRGRYGTLLASGEPYSSTHKSKKHLVGLVIKKISEIREDDSHAIHTTDSFSKLYEFRLVKF